VGVALTLVFIMALCSGHSLTKLAGDVKVVVVYCSSWKDKNARQVLKVAFYKNYKLSYHGLC